MEIKYRPEQVQGGAGIVDLDALTRHCYDEKAISVISLYRLTIHSQQMPLEAFSTAARYSVRSGAAYSKRTSTTQLPEEYILTLALVDPLLWYGESVRCRKEFESGVACVVFIH